MQEKLKYVFVGVLVFSVFFSLSSRHDQSEAPHTSVALKENAPTSTASVAPLSEEEMADREDDLMAGIKPLTKTLDTKKERTTRYGEVSVVKKDGMLEEVFYQGIPVGIVDHLVGLGRVIKDGDTDLMMVEMQSGGTACPASFVLLKVKPEGVSLSEPFGDCSRLARWVARPGNLVIRVGNKAFFANAEGIRRVRVSDALHEELQASLDSPRTDTMNMIRPLVNADKEMYRWCGTLKEADMNDPKADSFVFKQVDYYFAGIASNKDTARGLPLRVGGFVCVTGVYINNLPYETVMGEKRVMPLLAIHRITPMN